MPKREADIAPRPAQLGLPQMHKAIPRLRKRIDRLNSMDPSAFEGSPWDFVRPIAASIDDALIRTFGSDTVEYSRYKAAADFHWPIFMGRETPRQDIVKGIASSRQRAIDLLSEAIATLEERIEEHGGGDEIEPWEPEVAVTGSRVFVVHGHDQGARESVARFLERLGLEAVILHEQVNRNRTVIEKVELSRDIGFAVVLLTPDDEGCERGGVNQPRVRQNVLLELGYFMGRLGRDRVCVLKRGEVEIPSDFAGVIWTQMDEAGAWKGALGQELQAAGYSIDWNKIMRL